MLYLHIPFCHQACSYCDFHFSVSFKHKERLVEAMVRELELQRDYLPQEPLKSIYFGGGTPSVLEEQELDMILTRIHQLYEVQEGVEVTLEANPDDLTPEKLRMLKARGINRLSIGVQSFRDDLLRFMNRSHDAAAALQCIEDARRIGFDALSIDLIYGVPGLSEKDWGEAVDKVAALDIPHVSCYALTVEPNTPLVKRLEKGEVVMPEEEEVERQFWQLMEEMEANGYEHYEVSNFCRPGWRAVHNSGYWSGKSYLGIGPSAHSFNGTTRQWNVAGNFRYIQSVEAGEVPCERETIDAVTAYNEYIMTRLRTCEGLFLTEVEKRFGVRIPEKFPREVADAQEAGQVEVTGDSLRLTRRGILVADRLASELFLTEEAL